MVVIFNCDYGSKNIYLFKKNVSNFPTGFCMDLLNRLADKVNFTFEVHLSEDGSYGSLRRVSYLCFENSYLKKKILYLNQGPKEFLKVVK